MQARLSTSGYLERYCELMKEHPGLFSSQQENCLNIITDWQSLEAVQETLKRQAKADGVPAHYYAIGVLCEDESYIGLRDWVLLPNGKHGSRIRFVCKKSELEGKKNVVVIPYSGDKILLMRRFRHETRRWHWETPRGFGNDPDAAATARIKVVQETGLLACGIKPLFREREGNSGIFIAEVLKDYKISLANAREVNAESCWLTLPEVEQWIMDGEITDAPLLASFVYLQHHGFPK